MAKHKLTLARAKKKPGGAALSIARRGIVRKTEPAPRKPVPGGWKHDKFAESASSSGVQVVGDRRGSKPKVVLRRAGAAASKGAQTFQVNLSSAAGRVKVAGGRGKAVIRTGTAEVWGLGGKSAAVAKRPPRGNVDDVWSHDLFNPTQAGVARKGGGRSGGKGRGRGGNKKGRGRGGGGGGGGGGGYGHDDRGGSGMDLETRLNAPLGA